MSAIIFYITKGEIFMKKILSLLLIFIILFLCVGCNNENRPTEKATQTELSTDFAQGDFSEASVGSATWPSNTQQPSLWGIMAFPSQGILMRLSVTDALPPTIGAWCSWPIGVPHPPCAAIHLNVGVKPYKLSLHFPWLTPPLPQTCLS